MGVQRPVHDFELGHELVDAAVVEAGPGRVTIRCPAGSADEPLADVRALQAVRLVGVETCPPFEDRRQRQAVCFEALEQLRRHADGPSRDAELLDE